MLIQPAYPLSYSEFWGEGLHRSSPASACVNCRVDRTPTEHFLFSIRVYERALIFAPVRFFSGFQPSVTNTDVSLIRDSKLPLGVRKCPVMD